MTERETPVRPLRRRADASTKAFVNSPARNEASFERPASSKYSRRKSFDGDVAWLVGPLFPSSGYRAPGLDRNSAALLSTLPHANSGPTLLSVNQSMNRSVHQLSTKKIGSSVKVLTVILISMFSGTTAT